VLSQCPELLFSPRRSRAVFVELMQYHPSVDLHAAITLQLEFLGAGQAVTAVTISPFPLLRLSGGVTLQLLMMVSAFLPRRAPRSLHRGSGDPSPARAPGRSLWAPLPEAAGPHACHHAAPRPGQHTENVPGTTEAKEVPPAWKHFVGLVSAFVLP